MVTIRNEGNAVIYEYWFESDRINAEKRGQEWKPYYVCYTYPKE